jgi:hypothetical protein
MVEDFYLNYLSETLGCGYYYDLIQKTDLLSIPFSHPAPCRTYVLLAGLV